MTLLKDRLLQDLRQAIRELYKAPGFQLYPRRAVESPFDAQWFYSYPAYERLRQVTGASVIARSGQPGFE